MAQQAVGYLEVYGCVAALVAADAAAKYAAVAAGRPRRRAGSLPPSPGWVSAGRWYHSGAASGR